MLILLYSDCNSSISLIAPVRQEMYANGQKGDYFVKTGIFSKYAIAIFEFVEYNVQEIYEKGDL